MPISLSTPEGRDRLDVRDKPWFVRVSDALHLGYKKGKSISRWIVRFRTSTGYISRTMPGVVPDDAIGPGTVEVLLSPGIDFNIGSERLAELFSRTSFAMADEDTREFLRGVLLEYDRTQLRAVATNGHHLAIARCDVTTNVKALQHVIVPRDDVSTLTDWLQSMIGQSVNVTVQDNVLCLSSRDAEVRAPLVFGSYPNYRDVVPSHAQSFVVDRASLLALFDEACDSNDTGTLTASLVKGALTLSKSSGLEAQLNVDYNDDSIETGLDSFYLGNILRAIDGNRVRIAVKGREYPWRFESEQDDSATYVLMPVKVWEDVVAA